MFIGDEIEQCKDYSGIAYRRPFEKVRSQISPYPTDVQGMLVNWDAEKIIWDRLFSADVLNVSPSGTLMKLD